jgi:hypothetical protein
MHSATGSMDVETTKSDDERTKHQCDATGNDDERTKHQGEATVRDDKGTKHQNEATGRDDEEAQLQPRLKVPRTPTRGPRTTTAD